MQPMSGPVHAGRCRRIVQNVNELCVRPSLVDTFSNGG